MSMRQTDTQTRKVVTQRPFLFLKRVYLCGECALICGMYTASVFISMVSVR